MRIAYFTHASGMILYAMAIEHVELHVEFQDRLQTLIDCAHGQDGNFHDRWRQNSNAFTSAAIQGGPPTRTHTDTLSLTAAKSPQATADQHDRELVPSPSRHRRPLEVRHSVRRLF